MTQNEFKPKVWMHCPLCKKPSPFPDREWVGLMDKEVYEIYEATERLVGEHWDGGGTILMFPTTLYEAFEAKLKEKNI